MPSDAMIPLLALQSKDLELRKAVASLESFPADRARVEREMAAARAALEEARASVKASEVDRERMEDEVEAAREKIRKLKNQQLEVRKNEEYEALNHEIAALEQKIDSTEDREIELLDQIDEAKKHLAGIEEETNKEVAHLQKSLGKIDADEEDYRERLAGLRKEVENRRASVGPELLALYDGLWGQIKRPPVVVPLEDQKCGGCHLRVSNEVDAGVRAFKPVTCDQCGRLLYLE